MVMDFDFNLCESKQKAIQEKIENGESETIVWSELLTEFLSLQKDRVNAAIKRLTPHQMDLLVESVEMCRQESHQRAVEQANRYLSQLGISASDLITKSSNNNKKNHEPKPRKIRAWYRGFNIMFTEMLVEDPSRLHTANRVWVDKFIGEYPELTGDDIAKIKYGFKCTYPDLVTPKK